MMTLCESEFLSHAYNIKGESNLLIDTNQEEIKSGNCTLKNFLKSLFVLKKVLTFASAFENEGMKKEFFERFT